MNGVDLQRRLIDAGHRIPTIFMTAYPEERMRTAALPVRVGTGGVAEVVMPELSVVERVALDNAISL